MKITKIRTRNILGARDIDVRPNTAVTLFCGFNGAGKSSIQESLRLAMRGETLRVDLKKNYPLMVSDGAKEGYVSVEIDGAECSFKLPSGTHTLPENMPHPEQLNCVLNAQRFGKMTADERREFLMVLTKSRPNPEKIKALMLEAGLDAARIEMAIPMLKAGFPAACDLAKQKATESKGAWKGIAGGVWGSQKGEGWEAPEVEAPAAEELEAAKVDVELKEAEVARLTEQVGALAERANAAQRASTTLATARQQADSIPRLEEKLMRDRTSLTNYEAELVTLRAAAGTGPKEGLVHDFACFLSNLSFEGDLLTEAEALMARYVAEHGPVGDGAGDPDALAKIPAFERSVTLMRTSIETAERSLADARAAKARLAEAGEAEAFDPQQLVDAKAAVATATALMTEARKKLAELTTLQTAAEKRDEITAAAKAHHEDIIGWTKVAAQFAPDGLPAQIIAKALEPINKALRAAATATDWFQVAITPDMTITANGRLYTLLSESEQWMVDAHIAAVISQIAGLKLLVLDRFDVLDIRHRPELIYWLADMADAGEIDHALIFGTLKAVPGGLPENVEPIWINSGEIQSVDVTSLAA